MSRINYHQKNYNPGRKLHLPWSKPEKECFIPNSFFCEILASFLYIFLTQTQKFGEDSISFYAASTGLTVYLIIVLTHVEAICHFNPAITTAIFFVGRLPFGYMVMYLIAQFIGGLSASGLVFVVQKANLLSEFPGQEFTYEQVVSRYALDFNPEKAHWASVLIGEIFNSTHMCLITIVSLYNKNTFICKTGALACGLSVMIGIMSSFTLGGGCLNPLRSHAPWFYGKFAENWVFTVGPVIGSIFAAGLYHLLLDENRNFGQLKRRFSRWNA